MTLGYLPVEEMDPYLWAALFTLLSHFIIRYFITALRLARLYSYTHIQWFPQLKSIQYVFIYAALQKRLPLKYAENSSWTNGKLEIIWKWSHSLGIYKCKYTMVMVILLSNFCLLTSRISLCVFAISFSNVKIDRKLFWWIERKKPNEKNPSDHMLLIAFL